MLVPNNCRRVASHAADLHSSFTTRHARILENYLHAKPERDTAFDAEYRKAFFTAEHDEQSDGKLDTGFSIQ